jgi:thiamine biosynthesis lipoprotein
VRLARRGMELDLGAVGKGHAIDRAIAVLVEHGVCRALLHGGTSSVHTIGAASDGGAWRVAWRVPGRRDVRRRLDARAPALSISAVHGKGFDSGDGWRGHVLDPRRGAPTDAALSACVAGRSSTLCDALSTALLVNGASWRRRLGARFPGYEGWTAGGERIDGALGSASKEVS